MRLVVVTLAALAVARPAAAQPDTRAELDALEKKLVATLDVVRASAAGVVVSRGDQYPKAAAPAPPGRLGGFDPKAFIRDDPTPARAELAGRLDLADPRAAADHGAAAGVVIDPAGLVLTTHHVVDGATKVYVHLAGGAGSYADIHAADARSDLAVLKLLTPPAGLRAAPLGGPRPLPPPGKLVVVAAPRADGAAGVLGSVTSVHRIPAPDTLDKSLVVARSTYHFGHVLDLDGRANPGVSGAGVFATDGHLIGLTTTAAVAGSGGDAGQALPLDGPARRVLDTLRRGEEVEYGFLGVTVGDRPGRGIVLTSVRGRTPAALAGLSNGDVITHIDGNPADGYEDLLLYVGSAQAGAKVRLTLAGRGGPQPVEVTLAKYRSDGAFVASVRPEPVFGLRVDWNSIASQLNGTTGPPAPPGVYAREVVAGSPAEAQFKPLGAGNWVVTHVDGSPTPTPADFRAAANGKASVRLTVVDAADPAARPREVVLP